MIKCDGKTCCVSGIGIKIRSEFSTVVHATFTAMVEAGIPSGLAKEMLKKDFEDGLKSKDELKKRIGRNDGGDQQETTGGNF